MIILTKIKSAITFFRDLGRRIDRIQAALGRIEIEQIRSFDSDRISDFEVSIYSQWGEDGILQHVFRSIELPNKIFVEFGVENYKEANTRFLLTQKNWSGLVIDGSVDHIENIQKDDIYWRHSLMAKNAFITKENINALIFASGIRGDIGLLSIDIDGNDYWVWEAIDVIRPAVVIVEYNHRFGPERSVTIPYKTDFERRQAHYSTIYYGASLTALIRLGKRKGFAFIGCNSAGNNAFFVRRELLRHPLKEITNIEGFVAGKFRESRNENGALQFLNAKDEEKILSDLPVVEIY